MAIKGFYAAALTGGGADALDGILVAKISDLSPAFCSVSGVTYIYKYDENNNNATNPESSPDVIVPDDNATGTGAWVLMEAYASLPDNYISGFVISLDADTDHDINVTVGICKDSANAELMEPASELTKQIDAAWAVGDDAGGMATGAVAADTLYHIIAGKKNADASIDYFYDVSAIGANIDAAYTPYKWIGFVHTDGSANIDYVSQKGDGREVEIWFKARKQVATGLNSTSYATQSLASILPTAAGKVVAVLFGAIAAAGTTLNVWLSDDGVNAKTAFAASDTNNSIGQANELYTMAGAGPVFIPIDGDNIHYKVNSDSITLFIRAVRIQR